MQPIASGEIPRTDDLGHQGRVAVQVGPHAAQPLHQRRTLQDVVVAAEAGDVVEGELRVGRQIRKRRLVPATQERTVAQVRQKLVVETPP